MFKYSEKNCTSLDNPDKKKYINYKRNLYLDKRVMILDNISIFSVGGGGIKLNTSLSNFIFEIPIVGL